MRPDPIRLGCLWGYNFSSPHVHIICTPSNSQAMPLETSPFTDFYNSKFTSSNHYIKLHFCIQRPC